MEKIKNDLNNLFNEIISEYLRHAADDFIRIKETIEKETDNVEKYDGILKKPYEFEKEKIESFIKKHEKKLEKIIESIEEEVNNNEN